MNEFDYDVREKKSIASGARHRVNGSKSKRCTMPSDYLTPAQRKKLNGEVCTMNLNKPIGWSELKDVPTGMAKEYIENLHHTHRATIAGASIMLGVSKERYMKFCRDIGADVPTRRGRTSEKDKETWAEFIAQMIPHSCGRGKTRRYDAGACEACHGAADATGEHEHHAHRRSGTTGGIHQAAAHGRAAADDRHPGAGGVSVNKKTFESALAIHDAIETLKSIQCDILDHNHVVAIEASEGEYICLPGILRDRFAEWVAAQRELLEKEFERV